MKKDWNHKQIVEHRMKEKVNELQLGEFVDEYVLVGMYSPNSGNQLFYPLREPLVVEFSMLNQVPDVNQTIFFQLHAESYTDKLSMR